MKVSFDVKAFQKAMDLRERREERMSAEEYARMTYNCGLESAAECGVRPLSYRWHLNQARAVTRARSIAKRQWKVGAKVRVTLEGEAGAEGIIHRVRRGSSPGWAGVRVKITKAAPKQGNRWQRTKKGVVLYYGVCVDGSGKSQIELV